MANDDDDIVLNLASAMQDEIIPTTTKKKMKEIGNRKQRLKSMGSVSEEKPKRRVAPASFAFGKDRDGTIQNLNYKTGFSQDLKNTTIKKNIHLKDSTKSSSRPASKLKFSITLGKVEKDSKSIQNVSKTVAASRSNPTEDVFAQDSFSSISELNRRLVDRLENGDAFGFSFMTAIQKLTLPVLLSGKDCFVKSQTGSGKTLAYAIPCVQRLSQIEPRIKRQDGPCAVILTPTRELTIQTYEVFEKLLKAFIWLVPGYIAGGEKRKSEKARLRKGINVLVCTPGRLTDHLKHTNSLSLINVRWMIYDEADRLLDGGFEDDIKFIITKLRSSGQSHCQSVLLSATLNKHVSQLADLALIDPVFVTPSSSDSNTKINEGCTDESSMDAYVLPETLKQHYVVMPAKQRLLTLIALILHKLKHKHDDPCEKMLIFLATQDAVDFHYYLLDYILNATTDDDDNEPNKKRRRFNEDVNVSSSRIDIFRLHGNMSQQERTGVYKEFSKATKAVLLATDVASRGLHIPRLDCIVQYNTPGVAAEYVHRVGRTARMGRSGNAILFILPSETVYLDVLQQYKIRMDELQQGTFMDTLKKKARVDHLPEALHTVQRQCEEFVYSRQDVHEMATKAFISFTRAYTTYPKQLKSIFNVHALHLGHLAKSFALTETPKELASFRRHGNRDFQSRQSNQHRTQSYGRPERPGHGLNKMRSAQISHERSKNIPRMGTKKRKAVDMSEYGSGFDSINF